MNQYELAKKPLTNKERILTLTLFLLPMVPTIVVYVTKNNAHINKIGSMLTIGVLIFIFFITSVGIMKGLPLWSVPFLGALVQGIVILEGYRLI